MAVPDDARGRVAALVGELGERLAAERLGVGRATLTRLVAGLPVRAGTLALVRAWEKEKGAEK